MLQCTSWVYIPRTQVLSPLRNSGWAFWALYRVFQFLIKATCMIDYVVNRHAAQIVPSHFICLHIFSKIYQTFRFIALHSIFSYFPNELRCRKQTLLLSSRSKSRFSFNVPCFEKCSKGGQWELYMNFCMCGEFYVFKQDQTDPFSPLCLPNWLNMSSPSKHFMFQVW